MKLKAFNSETCIVKRAGKPAMGINFKIGLFRFNRECCEQLSLSAGDKVSLHQDEDEPGDWYLLIKDDKGFELRAKENVTNGLLFNNTSLARQIAESCECIDKSATLSFAKEPVKHDKKNYWPIITAALKKA